MSETWPVDFNSALFISTDPPAASGPADAPSVWFEFTETRTADWVASTSGFAHGATLELYSGPPGATADDLTFVATDGDQSIDLGTVTIAARPVTGPPLLVAKIIDFGAVTIAADSTITGDLT